MVLQFHNAAISVHNTRFTASPCHPRVYTIYSNAQATINCDCRRRPFDNARINCTPNRNTVYTPCTCARTMSDGARACTRTTRLESPFCARAVISDPSGAVLQTERRAFDADYHLSTRRAQTRTRLVTLDNYAGNLVITHEHGWRARTRLSRPRREQITRFRAHDTTNISFHDSFFRICARGSNLFVCIRSLVVSELCEHRARQSV